MNKVSSNTEANIAQELPEPKLQLKIQGNQFGIQ